MLVAMALALAPVMQAPPTQSPRVLDAGELRRVCLDLLGRPPLAEERARWIGQPAEATLL